VKVRYTRRARANLDDVLAHVAQDSRAKADRLAARIRAAIKRISSHPGWGRRTDIPEIRQVNTWPFPYLIFYRAGSSELTIIAIRHGSRNPRAMPAKPI
jgi:plasmid stabilization system protein ParE